MTFDSENFKAAVKRRLTREYSKDIADAPVHDIYDAVAASILDAVVENWMKTRSRHDENRVKKVYYFSAEFLMGRALSNNLINLRIKSDVLKTLQDMGFDYNSIEDQEPDAGLGKWRLGTLGRLFFGFACNVELSRNRLRHTLPVRHVRTAHRKRLSSRISGQLA